MLQSPFKDRESLLQGFSRKGLVAWFALAAIVGVLYFITAIVILHALRPDLNPATHAVSNYAVGPFAFLMTFAFFLLALSEVALAQGLVRSLARYHSSTSESESSLLLASYGFCSNHCDCERSRSTRKGSAHGEHSQRQYQRSERRGGRVL